MGTFKHYDAGERGESTLHPSKVLSSDIGVFPG